MKVLIELYDKDTLKNIVAPLTLRPDDYSRNRTGK